MFGVTLARAAHAAAALALLHQQPWAKRAFGLSALNGDAIIIPCFDAANKTTIAALAAVIKKDKMNQVLLIERVHFATCTLICLPRSFFGGCGVHVCSFSRFHRRQEHMLRPRQIIANITAEADWSN